VLIFEDDDLAEIAKTQSADVDPKDKRNVSAITLLYNESWKIVLGTIKTDTTSRKQRHDASCNSTRYIP